MSMPVNSKLMLADISLGHRQLRELLDAEQPELDLVRSHAEVVVLQTAINTADRHLPYYEKLYRQNSSGKSLAERRAALLVYKNGRRLVTPAYLAALLESILYCAVAIELFNPEYRMVVHITGQDISPNLLEARRWVTLLKPAHVEANLRYEQRIQGTVSAFMRLGIGNRLQVQPYQPEDVHIEGATAALFNIKSGTHLKVHHKEET